MKHVNYSQKVTSAVQSDLSKVQGKIVEAANGYPKLTKIAAAVDRGQISGVKNIEQAIKQLPAKDRPSIFNSKEIIENLRTHISQAKIIKKAGRYAKVEAANSDYYYRLPGASMSEHLIAKTKIPVIQTAKRCLSLAVSGSSSYSVHLTSDPAEVGMVAITYKDWKNKYRGSFKGYPATGIKVEIKVPKGWLFRVKARNLHAVDGLFTLDAQKLHCQNSNIEVYAAQWVEQSRGKSVKVISGYISVTKDREISFHGATPDSAIQGLLKKIRISEDPDFSIKLMKESIDRFCARHEKSPFFVNVSDAKNSGSCEYGIRSWCGRVGIDYDRGSVPVKEALAAYRQVPLPEVRRAILHAARRWSASNVQTRVA